MQLIEEKVVNTMNILFFALTFYPFNIGGMEKYLINVVQALKNRHKIVLFLASKHNISIQNVSVYHFLLPETKTGFQRIFYNIRASLSIIFQLPRVLRKEKIDVVSCFIPTEASIIVQFLAKLMGKKTIINIRGLRKETSKSYIMPQDFTLLFSDQVIVNSRDLYERYLAKSLLLENYLKSKKWAYIPNAINTKLWDPVIAEEKYDIVFLGNLQDKSRIIIKGFIPLLQACEILKNQYEFTPKLLVIGKYNLNIIQKMSKNADLSYITFTGHIQHRSAVKELLAQGKSFVLSSAGEGMPNSLMEAMALGKACIATAVGAVEDLIENGVNGLVVPPEDPGSLAAAIMKLSSDDNLRSKFGIAARDKMISKFSWEFTVKALEVFYAKGLTKK